MVISDSVGTGATATVTIRGLLTNSVVDGGFGYINPPTVTIGGGNGEGARAEGSDEG